MQYRRENQINQVIMWGISHYFATESGNMEAVVVEFGLHSERV